MGVFKHYSRETPPSFSAPDPAPYIPLKRLWSEAEYLKRFNAVQNYIQSGDVYQVNLTFPMTGTFSGEPLGLYAALRRRQRFPCAR